jgi:AraC family transcriptional regulator
MSSSAAAKRADGARGRNLGQRYGAEDAPFIVTGALRGGGITVTEIRVDQPTGRLTDPFPPEDAYMLCLLLRERPDDRYWECGRQLPVATLRAGDTTIHDLTREPFVLLDKPIHSLLMHLPRATLDALADAANVPRIAGLRYQPGIGVADETIKSIGLTLLPAVRAPDQVSRLFMDHLTLALAAHVAQTYGGMQTRSEPIRGGLAPWQEKRSKEMLAADLTGATSLSEIALACGLSVSHFARAFRRSTGLAPHAWLQRHRVDLAKDLLRRREQPLAEIALACGFANQNHFTRVFTTRVGLSPGVWRRYLSG